MDSGEFKELEIGDAPQARMTRRKFLSALEFGALIFVVDFLVALGVFVGLIFNSFEGNHQSENARDVLEDDVVHYSFTRSCFDVLVLSFLRSILLLLFVRHRSVPTESAPTKESLYLQIMLVLLVFCGSIGVAIAKLVLFDFARALTWLEYVLLGHSLVVAAGEAGFVFSVFRREFSLLSRDAQFSLLLNDTRGISGSASMDSLLRSDDGELTEDEIQENKRSKEETKQIAKRIVQLWKEDTGKLILAVVFLLGGSITSLFLPKYTGLIVAQVLAHEDARPNMLLLLIFTLTCGCCVATRGYMMTVIGEDFELRIRARLHEALLRQDISFFDTSKVGDFSSRLTSDITVVADSITLNANVFLRSSVALLGATIYMFTLSWRLSLMTLSILPFFGAANFFFGNYQKKMQNRIQDVLGQATSLAVETLNAIRTVRSFSTESWEVNLYTERVTERRRLAVLVAFYYGLDVCFSNILSNGATLLVLFYGSKLIEWDRLSDAHYTQFVFYVEFLVLNMDDVTSVYAALMKAVGAGERIFQVMDRVPSVPSQTGLAPSTAFAGHVSFKDTHFKYPGTTAEVLRGITFDLLPGHVFAIVGPSGSGKSTVVHLIERFYDVTGGSVELDNIDIRKLDPRWFHRGIGLVSQEPSIFARTVEQNIAYGMNPGEYKPGDVERAAHLANAHEFINMLAKGYQTVLGEKGVNLSGGQKQRLAIARALMKNPRLLVFDEATSALDSQSEQEVQKAIDSICSQRDRSVLIIAHRLSTVRYLMFINADCILVMQDGGIVERGRHEELLKNDKGLYRALVEAQLKEEKEEKSADKEFKRLDKPLLKRFRSLPETTTSSAHID